MDEYLKLWCRVCDSGGGGICVKHTGFEERLDGILVRAAIRLQERMRLAYFRGNLPAYLERIGLAKHIDPAVLARGSLLELLDETVVIMAAKLRQARAAGSLKDCLEQMNLLELLRKDLPVRLSDDSAPVRDSQKGGRKERKHHEKKVRLKMVEGENKSSAMTTEEKKNLLKTFKVIK